jgi:hypothetical protein
VISPINLIVKRLKTRMEKIKLMLMRKKMNINLNKKNKLLKKKKL